MSGDNIIPFRITGEKKQSGQTNTERRKGYTPPPLRRSEDKAHIEALAAGQLRNLMEKMHEFHKEDLDKHKSEIDKLKRTRELPPSREEHILYFSFQFLGWVTIFGFVITGIIKAGVL